MKTNKKISLSMIALMAVVFATSCSVEYRNRHPHRHWGYEQPVNNDTQAASVAKTIQLPQSVNDIQVTHTK